MPHVKFLVLLTLALNGKIKIYWWTLVAILILAAALRIWALDWGLPQEFHPDEPLVVPRAIDAVVKGDWNPHYFLVPSLQTNLTSIAYSLVYAAGRVCGTFDNPGDFGVWAARNYGTLYLIGRGISVLLGLLVVLGTAFLAREVLRSNPKNKTKQGNGPAAWTPLFAAAVIAVSPLATSSSRFITPDIPMLAFYTWSVWAILKGLRTGNPRMLILAGFLAGLAISAKYTAAILIIPLIIGFILLGRDQARLQSDKKDGRSLIPAMAAAFGCMLPGFLIGTPYALLDWPVFLEHLQIQYIQQHEGHLGMEKAGLTILQMLRGFFTREGAGLIILAIIGVWTGWTRGERFRGAWWVIVPLLVVYLIEVSRWQVYADRYLLPALPLLAVWAALGLGAVAGRIQKRGIRVAASVLLILALLLPPLLVNVKQTSRRLLPDTRTLALAWIEKNIDSGSRVLLEIGGPQPADLNADYHRDPAYDLVILPPWFSDTSRGTNPPLAILLGSKSEYAITSSNYRGRYESLYAQKRFPEVTSPWQEYYAYLDSNTELVYEVEPGEGLVGPSIWIYRINPLEADGT